MFLISLNSLVWIRIVFVCIKIVVLSLNSDLGQVNIRSSVVLFLK